MADYLAEIAKADTQIANLQAQAAAYRSSAAEWDGQSKIVCNQLTKSKRSDCEADKLYKAQKAKGLYAAADECIKSITAIEATKRSLQALLDADAVSKVELAKQGKDLESMRMESDGLAKATQLTAAAQGEATIRAAEITATGDADSTKTRNMILTVAGIILLIGILFAIWKKFKKKKPKN